MSPPILGIPRSILCSSILLWLAIGIANGAPFRIVTLNIFNGLDAPGTTSYDSALAVLKRIDADVVVLEEVEGTDISGSPSNIDQLADDLADAPAADFFTFIPSTSGVFDSTKRNVVLSRYSITSSEGVTSPPGAKDMTRRHAAIVVDVPGTDEDPVIIGMHLKCCLDFEDPFRRAVEVDRALDYLVANSLTASDNIIILGDFNLIGSDQTYTSLPAGLPASYILGSDITFPVEYTGDPATYFTSIPIQRLDSLQLDGSPNTQGSSTLDHIMASPALTGRPHATEIYNSILDIDNVSGLPKAGAPLPPATSANASDHLAVFGDFDLPDSAVLGLSVAPSSVAESDPSGSARPDNHPARGARSRRIR